MVQLITGKRYMWPAKPQVRGTRWVNGLFTGEYDPANGNAILVTTNGERWSVPVEECAIFPKR
jgi:hypothetical protein